MMIAVRGPPPIWIVSLEHATERRAKVSDAFASLDVPFEIVDAVDGAALSAEQIARYSNWRSLFAMGRPMERGMLGASLSHLSLWERMVAEQVPIAGIFEDDVEPCPELRTVLESLDVLPPDWSVVTLHSLFQWADPQPVDAPPIAGEHRICTYRRTPLGAQGYLLRLDAAMRLVEIATPIAWPPDELLFRTRPAGLRRYGIEPPVLVHRETTSEIRGRAELVVPARATRRPGDHVVVLAGKVWFRVVRRFDRWGQRRRAAR